MAEDSAESCIALRDLKVGVAYSGLEHLNERFSRPSRHRRIADELELAVKPEGLHVRPILSG
jgi:hypothetical protein